jgi:Sulfotransferase family
VSPVARRRDVSRLPSSALAVPLDSASEAEAAAEYRSILEHRLKYLVAVDQPLVLIAQVGRSGGTLLVRLFDGHAQCHVVPYELQQTFRGMSLDLRPAAAWQSLVADKLFARRRPFVLRPGLQRAIFEASVEQLDDPGPREVLNCFFTSYFNAWLDNANLRSTPKRWVVGFEPRGATKLDAYRRHYPDGRVISLIRDPWSWYASRGQKKVKWGDVEVALDTWRAQVSAALELHAESPRSVALVLFSDLLGRTEATMRALAGWLGLDFEKSLVTPSFNGLPVAARSSFGDVGKEISLAPLERRDMLSPKQSSYLERHARDLFERAVAGALVVEPDPRHRSD